MGRIRTIKPEFPQSESVGRLTRDARLFFILLWTVVDDEGRARASSRLLASLLYPYDDGISSLIDGWMKELEREDCVQRYYVGAECYLQVSKWQIHQKIDRPSKSKFPSIDEASRVFGEDSTTDLGPGSVPVPVPVPGPRTMDQEQPPVVPPPAAPEAKPAKAKKRGLDFNLPELEMSPAEEEAFERTWSGWPKEGWNFSTKSASPRRIHRVEAAKRFRDILKNFPYTKGDGSRIEPNDLAEAALAFVAKRRREAGGGPPNVPCIDNFFSSVEGQKHPWKDAIQDFFAAEVAL